MILTSLIYLAVVSLYLFINLMELSYFGVFIIVILNLFFCSIKLFWNIYMYWLYNYSEEYYILNWVNLGNNIYITINFKENLLNNIFSFIMIFGAIIVTTFVFFEMYNDKEGHSFILLLNYFMVFMLIVIGSNNLIFFYLGWEGISLTSYFLVNFWSERVRSLKAVLKIFIISKIGDFFIILFICLIIKFFGTVDFDHLLATSLFLFNLNNLYILNYININELLGIILLLGSSIKSAQYGLHIWLLEAMEAPLGASALMHSSTLVIAGVILLLKLSFIIESSTYAQFFMFILGLMSATMGSLLACFQYELKVILAYSTISNMGYIFLLFSIGAYYEMVLVLIIHAFIKIYMFLIIGGIIYHCNGLQDIRWMGGILIYNPFLWLNYIIGGISLIGLPYLSGYYYKNYLLNILINSNNYLIGGEIVLLISYFFTIFYVVRLGYLVFLTNKNGHKSIYKVKKISIFYIVTLLFLSLVVSFLHIFWINLLFTNNNISTSIFFNSINNYSIKITELTYLSAYLWVSVYIFIFIFIFIYMFITLNHNYSFFKNLLFLTNLFFTLFIYFTLF